MKYDVHLRPGSRIEDVRLHSSDLALDSSRCVYVTGYTYSVNFPVTPGAFSTSLTGGRDVFVTKINSEGTEILYSTYIGGRRSDNIGMSIDVDSSGHAYVTGYTATLRDDTLDFPTTPGAFQTVALSTYSAFVTKLNPTGTALVYSTYLGGSTPYTFANNIVIDEASNAYVTGTTRSADFPVTPGVYQPTLAGFANVFVTKLNPAGTALVYSTFLGGQYGDIGTAITIDSAGNAYLTGNTTSLNFPVTPGAFQSMHLGYINGFVTELNAVGSELIYSTYFCPITHGVYHENESYRQRASLFHFPWRTHEWRIECRRHPTGCLWPTSPDFPVTTDAIQPEFGEIVMHSSPF